MLVWDSIVAGWGEAWIPWQEDAMVDTMRWFLDRGRSPPPQLWVTQGHWRAGTCPLLCGHQPLLWFTNASSGASLLVPTPAPLPQPCHGPSFLMGVSLELAVSNSRCSCHTRSWG